MHKRAQFTTGVFPDQVNRHARRRNKYKYSLAVLIIDPRGQHLVCAYPASAIQNGFPVLVPPQQCYNDKESILFTAPRLIQSLVTYRLQTESVKYLGYGFDNQHYLGGITKRHSEHVHWYSHVVPETQRLRQFHRLLQETSEFSAVQWLRIGQFLSIHNGGIVSDEKLRLTMQALWVLTREERLQESLAARVAGQYLAAESLLSPVT